MLYMKVQHFYYLTNGVSPFVGVWRAQALATDHQHARWAGHAPERRRERSDTGLQDINTPYIVFLMQVGGFNAPSAQTLPLLTCRWRWSTPGWIPSSLFAWVGWWGAERAVHFSNGTNAHCMTPLLREFICRPA
jgi:hypothetical protein